MVPSLKLTFSPLKMDGWKTSLFPFGARRFFQVQFAVSFRECKCKANHRWDPKKFLDGKGRRLGVALVSGSSG